MESLRELTEHEKELIKKIYKRANDMNITNSDLMSSMMDITSALFCFNMRLEDWYKADDFNFAHDYVGIENNVVRDKFPSKNFGYFLPRFSGKECD